ncbi:glycosyltransferase family 4 protein [Stenomitos frigidus]|uniref:Glycosyltransferase family 1 protein n=1 Tax=Stenomitos frigidus ULC18 TaxID=2107698 RepID=A0A2T1DZR6_9CYAN|nr:glycosyltransferase family 4 protein [Stenomitos frigidus]PSB25985.1 glycosyltransferase family 1 protein [Stenomitos frigidus ULC18]
MKLLYTLTAYPPSVGGAQIHQHSLAQQLHLRHSVQVVSHWDANRTDWLLGTTLRAPATSRDYAIDDIPVHRLGLSVREKIRLAPYIPLYYPLMQVALPPIANLLETHIAPFAAKADVIHNIRIGREGLSYASYQAAQRYDRPFVLTPVHHPRWVGWRYRAYLKLYQMADAVIALTQAEKQILMGLGVGEERITVTGVGPVLAPTADPIAFLKHYSLEGPIVLFLGQHYPYKGYQQMLQAAPLVWQTVPEAQFVFMGPPVADSEQAFAQVSDRRIHRLGNVDLQTKTDALAACTLVCVPSSQESFGGIYTEAWNFGKPVIGCDIPAVAEVISDGSDGLLTTQEPDQIADRLLALLLHPTDAIAMGAAGKHKVESRFTWEKVAEQVEEVYRKVISG